MGDIQYIPVQIKRLVNIRRPGRMEELMQFTQVASWLQTSLVKLIAVVGSPHGLRKDLLVRIKHTKHDQSNASGRGLDDGVSR